MNESDKLVFVCPSEKCGQKLCIPRLKTILKITCPKCKNSFSTEDMAFTYWKRGMDFYAAGDSVSALDYFRSAVDIRGRADVHDLHWLGATLAELGRNEEALPILNRVVELSGDGINYHWLGTAYYRLGKYDEALCNLETAYKLLKKKKSKFAYLDAEERMLNVTRFWLGRTLTRLERYSEALDHLEEALEFLEDQEPELAIVCRQDENECRKRLSETSNR